MCVHACANVQVATLFADHQGRPRGQEWQVQQHAHGQVPVHRLCCNTAASPGPRSHQRGHGNAGANARRRRQRRQRRGIAQAQALPKHKVTFDEAVVRFARACLCVACLVTSLRSDLSLRCRVQPVGLLFDVDVVPPCFWFVHIISFFFVFFFCPRVDKCTIRARLTWANPGRTPTAPKTRQQSILKHFTYHTRGKLQKTAMPSGCSAMPGGPVLENFGLFRRPFLAQTPAGALIWVWGLCFSSPLFPPFPPFSQSSLFFFRPGYRFHFVSLHVVLRNGSFGGACSRASGT